MNGKTRSAIQALGSLWWAAVLLVVLLVSMAGATIFESRHGTERAMAVYYGSWWFFALVCLLAVNTAASLIARFPTSLRQIGFAVTHVSILVIFFGGLLTRTFGVDGRLTLNEGQTADSFAVSEPTLTATCLNNGTAKTFQLDKKTFDGFDVVDRDAEKRDLHAGDLAIGIKRYLPHCSWRWYVRDDNPRYQPAAKVAFGPAGAERSGWVFPGGPTQIGRIDVAFTLVADETALQRLLARAASSKPATAQVRAEVAKEAFTFDLDACLGQTVPLGNTGYSLRVLRYLPHARVEMGKPLQNRSEQPLNPAIEAEILDPHGHAKPVRAFARFPDFPSMHGAPADTDIKITLLTASRDVPDDPPALLLGLPDGRTFARLRGMDGTVQRRELRVGETVETPWPGIRLTLQERLSHARVDYQATEAEPTGNMRIPALLLGVRVQDSDTDIWVQKYQPRTVALGPRAYEFRFDDQTEPLGFEVTLDRFHMDRYPGEPSPRTFESFITITDPGQADGRAYHISMNNPASHGGYSFFQSSYNLEGKKRSSTLSVTADPGMPVVFAGYIGLIAGMLLVLCTRRGKQAAYDPPLSAATQEAVPV
jgi:hypothetical protein